MKFKSIIFIVAIASIILGIIFLAQPKKYKKPIVRIIERPFGEPLKKEPKALPNEWIGYQRTYPYSEIKQMSYLTAMKQAQQLHENTTTLRNYEWEFAGPTNIGGRITDIAVHPNSPLTWYVGAATGGIFKTTNGGENWENIFMDAPVITIGDIAIDPNDEEILYAGIGEANSTCRSFMGNGLYKTIDGGNNWQHIGLDNSAYIGRIVVDYSNSERIFTAACGTLFSPNDERGIYRSNDGGLNWDRIFFVSDSTAAIDIVQHPTSPDILYISMWERIRGLGHNTISTGGLTSGIYKTIDGGNSWVELTNGLPTGENVGRIGLAISQSNPQVLYSFYDKQPEPDDFYSFLGVFKTVNGGDSWEQTNDSALTSMNYSFGWYFGQIRVDPINENRVYVLGVELYRTDNGGNNWIQLGGYSNIEEIYVDHHAMYIDENSGLIIEGNDGGLYLSENYGDDWEKIDNIPLTQFYTIEIDKNNPERIYGGTQDNNTIRTMTGALDDWERILGGDGFYCLVDHANPMIIYAESQYGNLKKSTNGGNSFYSINASMSNDRTNWSSPLVMDPIDSSTLFFGTYRVWKSINSGINWTPVSEDLTKGDDGTGYHTISTLAISPINTDIIIAGTDDGKAHISTNGGTEWSEITSGIPDRWVTRVKADPFDVNTIYLSVSGFRWDEPQPHILKSYNLGQDWEDISSNLPELPINCLVLDPEHVDRIIIGTDSGVFFTENGGENWQSLSNGIPNVPIYDIAIHNETRTLVIGTHGCSAYKTNLDEITEVMENTFPITPSAQLFQNYPNPFNPETTISYSLSKRAEVELAVYNVKGQKVKVLAIGTQEKGKHTATWNGKDLHNNQVSSGSYFYKLKVDGKTVAVKKCMLLK
jgi:photosystem II stability/assembly factor-like uncharacterized protein